jgi:hypothetical protein
MSSAQTCGGEDQESCHVGPPHDQPARAPHSSQDSGPGTLGPGALGPWDPGPWDPGTLGPWGPGAGLPLVRTLGLGQATFPPARLETARHGHVCNQCVHCTAHCTAKHTALHCTVCTAHGAGNGLVTLSVITKGHQCRRM